ncbi:MAG: hypothetical protein EA384_07490 [Spirochaetaceae bacterium]|nr:MAG: hypothetical protein EA384_07490 [Spirochaetaceae bacterium]
MTGRDYCSRRDLECKPGAEGCVLRGRVVFADQTDPTDARAADAAAPSGHDGDRPVPRGGQSAAS